MTTAARILVAMLLVSTAAVAAGAREAAAGESRPVAKDAAKAAALLQEGVRLHDEGRFDEALATYRKALELDPDNVEISYEISFTLQALGRYQECAENAEAHRAGAGELERGYWAVEASCVDSAGDPERAAGMFDQALAKFPHDPVIEFNAGLSRLRTHEPDRARMLLEGAVRDRPFHPSSHLYLAVAFQQGGFRVPAILAFLRFLSLAPDDPRAQSAAAQVLRMMGEGVEQAGEKEIRITVPSGGSGEEGDFGPVELVLPMAAAVVETEKWRDRSEGEKLVYRFDLMLGSLEETAPEGATDFARVTYLPFTRELRARKMLEPFVYELFAPLGLPGMSDWLEAHPEPVKALHEFLQARSSP